MSEPTAEESAVTSSSVTDEQVVAQLQVLLKVW